MSNRIVDLAQDPATNLIEINDSADGNTRWSIGFDLQASSADAMLGVADPCSEYSTLVAGKQGQQNGSTRVYHIKAFSAVVSARRNNMCANGEELTMVQELLANGGLTSALEYALWNGINVWDPAIQPSLQNNDVLTVSAVANNPAETLAAALIKYAQTTPLQGNVVHLGLKAAFDLTAAGYAYNLTPGGILRIRATDSPVVVSPYYPTAGIAVTGPIEINTGAGINAWQTYSAYDNRTNISGDTLATIAFDPGTSVRAV